MKIENFKIRLEEFGIVPLEEEEPLLFTMLQSAKRYLLARIGQEELPEGAEDVVLTMAAGEYLLWRNSKGDLEGFDTEPVIRQISQGDTSITYGVGNDHLPPVEELAKRLLNPPEAVINQWRRFRW